MKLSNFKLYCITDKGCKIASVVSSVWWRKDVRIPIFKNKEAFNLSQGPELWFMASGKAIPFHIMRDLEDDGR